MNAMTFFILALAAQGPAFGDQSISRYCQSMEHQDRASCFKALDRWASAPWVLTKTTDEYRPAMLVLESFCAKDLHDEDADPVVEAVCAAEAIRLRQRFIQARCKMEGSCGNKEPPDLETVALMGQYAGWARRAMDEQQVNEMLLRSAKAALKGGL